MALSPEFRFSGTVVRIFLGIDKVDIVVPLDNKEKYRQVSEANDTVKRYVLLYRGTAGLFFVGINKGEVPLSFFVFGFQAKAALG